MTEQEVAKKMVKQLTKMGYKPDEMIRVLRTAKEMFNNMNKKNPPLTPPRRGFGMEQN
jgi:Holliday junction resolvasome RuvABC DNA-binding subunit